MNQKFSVSGMMCAACVAHVEKAVNGLSGVSECAVSLLTSSMTVSFDEDKLTEKDIILAVKKAGYKAKVTDENGSFSAKEQERVLKKRLVLSVLFTLLLMYVSMGHMIGAPLPSLISPHKSPAAFILVQLVLTMPVMVLNRKYFIGGIYALIRRAPSMESLIAIGSGAAFLYGIYVLVASVIAAAGGDITAAHAYTETLYFESAAMILTLVLLGKTLEAYAKERTTGVLEKLISISPKTANRLTDGVEDTVSVSELMPGDILIVRSGERIPADGVIVNGNASVDTSVVTGESLPRELSDGDTVIGGTSVLYGYFEMKVTKTEKEGVLSEIIRLVSEAVSSKAPIARLADKVSGIFVPIVIGISALTFVAWLIAARDTALAFNFAVSVLVISCPCALGLATPVAITVASGKGAELGILIKNARSLETVGKIKTVFLDKTGTLTEGKATVDGIIPSEGVREELLLTLASSAESLSGHPLAVGIVKYAQEKGIKSYSAKDYSLTEGGGISALVDGKKVFVGNEKMFDHVGAERPRELPLGKDWQIPLYVICDGKYLGAIMMSDKVRAESAFAVKKLSGLGVKTVMLTGDREKTAAHIAEKTGVDGYVSGMLPADKNREIASCEHRPCAMVGDGINDAPALAAADVGIAVGSGTDIAIDSADIILTSGSLSGAVNALLLGRKTVRVIKQNLFWALFYNSLGIPVASGALYHALGIHLTPMIAAACMSVSSLFVVFNALRINLFKGIKK